MLVARGPVDVDVDTDTDTDTGDEPDDSVVVDATQRRRSRFRTRTSAGEEVGVVVEAARVLSAGDRLRTDDGRLLVVELESVEVLVADLPSAANPAELVVAGHAVGNRHWDLATRDGRVYVPAGDHGDDGERRAFLRSWLPAGTEIQVEQVEPGLFDDSFGNADDHDHGHDHDHDHDHGHETDVTLDDVRRAAREREEERG
jgi:urease accessory protein